MTALPPTYYLHVWWARRPLVASRAAILASVLPATADRRRFLDLLGIFGDPVRARRLLDQAHRTGVHVKDPYGYERAFKYAPDSDDVVWLRSELGDHAAPSVLDPTAGGGSIPFESVRLGLATFANDLNPVAVVAMQATVEYPVRFGQAVRDEFIRLAAIWRKRLGEELSPLYPQSRAPAEEDITYLWARTITCPYCDGLIPLSPNWRLASDGTGIRIMPKKGKGPGSQGRRCEFEITKPPAEPSPGTVADGDATCPFPDCGRVVDGDEVKRQAQAGGLGEQLYAVVFRRRIEKKTKSGKRRVAWERGYRAPRLGHDDSREVASRLAEKLPEWEALDIVPSEKIPVGHKTDEPQRYGMQTWRDLFSPRQLLCHGTSVAIYREMLDQERTTGKMTELQRAAFVYLALALDTMLNYGNRACRWDSTTGRVRSIFDRHDFAFIWSYGEMAPVAAELGYDWTIEKTAKCIEELVELVSPDATRAPQGDFLKAAKPKPEAAPPTVSVSCKSADNLDHIPASSVEVVVMDPPYYDNVMYAELSDFFYVWLKRTAGHVIPELFRLQLTDKENEAVANPAKFRGQKGAKALAGRDYQERMAAIFAECRRILKPDGIMTLMFTHKATGAWDALTRGLIEAGFIVTASWPINTEAEGSLHIKDKAAANSTIFLVCRPKPQAVSMADELFWEDVEPMVGKAVRARVKEFQDAGVMGIDLFLAAFGPALEEFSRHWPLKRGTPRGLPETRRRRAQLELLEEATDPYAVTPEDALDAARREVKRWRLEQLTHLKANADLDPVTAFFVLAWDAFKAPTFDYDEALRLARAVGVDLDHDLIGRLAEKKGSSVTIWDSTKRAAKGALGPADGSRAMIDAIHHAAHAGRARNLAAARELLAKSGVDKDPRFFASLEAVLEVLPVSQAFTGIEQTGEAASAASDFEALEKLRRLAFKEDVDEPAQLNLFKDTQV